MNQREYHEYLARVTTIEVPTTLRIFILFERNYVPLILKEDGLQRVLDDTLLCSLFKQFLDEEHSSEHLLFWLEADVFSSMEDPAKLKGRAQLIFSKYFVEDSKYEINVNSSILSTIRKRLENDTIDTELFKSAQSSVFSLLEMDSFPRFLNSDIYLKYKESQQEKEKIGEDLTYLLVRMKEPLKGVKFRTHHSPDHLTSYPECAPASEIIQWMVQRLYLSDRSAAIQLGETLQKRHILTCVSDPKGNFSDNSNLWRLSDVDPNLSHVTSLKSVEEILQTLPFRTCDRKSFSRLETFLNYSIEHLDILAGIISNPWVISRKERDKFSEVVVALFQHEKLLQLLHLVLEKDFQKKEKGSLIHVDNSLIDSLLDTYFLLLCPDFLRNISKRLFDQNLLEESLSFDLRNESEDVSMNQRKFLKFLRTLVEPLWDQSVLSLIPPKVREVASILSSLGKSFHSPKTENMLRGTLQRVILRPDQLGVVPRPFIPLPSVKENLFLLNRSLGHLIHGTTFHSLKGPHFMAFTNDFLKEAQLKLSPSLTFFSTPSPISEEISLTIQPKFTDYAHLITILYDNKENVATVCNQLIEEHSPPPLSSFTSSHRRDGKIYAKKVHQFAPSPSTVSTPNWCMFCGEFMWMSSALKCVNEGCQCHIHKECHTKVPPNCGGEMYRLAVERAADPSHLLVGNFFILLQQSYELITRGNEAAKFKLFYSPIFPSAKFILSFCLDNFLWFEPHPLDFMYGDLKEEPILVDQEITLSDSFSILRYLADKFCVSPEWYPSSVQTLSAREAKRHALIEQWISWGQTHVCWPIHQIFWEEVFPRINSSYFPFTPSRQSIAALHEAYGTLHESLALLEVSLADKTALIGEGLNIVDVVLAEELSSISLFQHEALESYPNVSQWIQHIKDSTNYWGEVNKDFNAFFQFLMTVSNNETLPCVTFSLSFTSPAEKIYSQMIAATKYSQNHLLESGLVPERVVIKNYKDTHIPPEHFSALEFQLRGTPERIPNTKLFFQLINAPTSKLKLIQEEWQKHFKAWGGIQVTEWQSSIYIPFTMSFVWELLLNAGPLTTLTKTKCAITPKCGEKFSLFDGSVTGSIVQLETLETILQKWRMNDWPEHHFSSLKYSFESCNLGGIKGTLLQCTQWNIPVDKVKDMESKHKELWKKAKGYFVETLEYNAYFSNTTSSEVLKTIESAINSSGSRLSTRSERSTLSSHFIAWDLPSDHRGILSKIKLSITELGGRDVRTKKACRVKFVHENLPKGKVKLTAELWDKFLWKKVDGVLVDVRRQSHIFNLTPPSEVYENLLNIGKFTLKRSTLSTASEVDDTFTLNDETVSGVVLKLTKNRNIELKWRESEWPEEHHAIVKFTLQELFQETSEGIKATTKLLFTMEDIPVKHFESQAKFWNKFWKRFRNSKGGIASETEVKKTKSFEKVPIKSLTNRMVKKL